MLLNLRLSLGAFRAAALGGILDQLSVQSTASYSLRKLRTAYTGSAIRVRRSSDNAELDIGFTADDDLDQVTLLNHCGAGNGFVTTWYDQSGNGRNATNTTAGEQPQIVASGVINSKNGKPTIRNLSTSTNLQIPTANFFRNVPVNAANTVAFYPSDTTYLANGMLVFASVGTVVTSTRFGLTPSLNPGGNFLATAFRRLDGDGYTTRPSTQSSLVARGALFIQTGIVNHANALASHYYNGAESLAPTATGLGTGNTSNTDPQTVRLFHGSIALSSPVGTEISEVTFFDANLSTNDRQLLEANQGTFYGITLSSFDADAQAYITAVEAADGQALEGNVKVAINNFVVGCKADGIWEAIKASCIMAGARTLNGALVPLKGTAPTNFNFVAGDYDRKTGLVGNGTTKYLDSNRNNNADPQDNKHLSAYVTVNPVTGGVAQNIGGTDVIESGASWLRRSANNTTSSHRTNTATSYDYTDGFPLAFSLIGSSRSASSANSYFAASGVKTSTEVSTTPANRNIFFFRAVGGYSDARLSFYSIGEALDLALLDARVTTLINNTAFVINTGLNPASYDADTIKYINAGYAAGGTLL